MIYELFDDIRDCDGRENGSFFSGAFINAFLRTM